MGSTKGSLTWLLVVCVCVNVASTNAWGTYLCDIKEQGLQKIGEICSGSAAPTGSPISFLEEKLDKILKFVEDIKTTEDSWLYTERSGTVERDLSWHEEKILKETEDEGDKETADDREGDAVDTVVSVDSDQSRQETSDDSQGRGEEHTRIEDDHQSRRDRTHGGDWRDRRGGYDWEKRRDRTNRYDWRNRRDYTSRPEREDVASQRTDEGDREDAKERTSGEETRSTSVETVDSREHMEEHEVREEEEERELEPKKGECSAIVMDSHETIGMFYMMSYQHGHCSNRNPINHPIRSCLGYCATKTFLERESGIWSQGNDCKSCQPLRFETIKIPLACDDGFTFEKRFQNIVDCSCRRCQPVDNNRRP